MHANPDGLVRRGDVHQVALWLIPDGEIPDRGAIVTVDLTNGLRLASLRDGVFVEPSRLTLGTYLTEVWLPSMGSQVRATTLAGYRHNVHHYIVPRPGDTPLQRLTTARVGALYGDLVASGGQDGRPLSATTVRYVHTTLRRALRDAVADGLVARNVAAQARPPAPAG